MAGNSLRNVSVLPTAVQCHMGFWHLPAPLDPRGHCSCSSLAHLTLALSLHSSCCYKHPPTAFGLCLCFFISFHLFWRVYPPIANSNKWYQLFTCTVHRRYVSNFDWKIAVVIRYSEKDLDTHKIKLITPACVI